ncbi:hypothetical protein GUJ93_ZPchr0014g46812 [Zizania palustris]|uniref:Uncharacterized protein n=1 Tax=Zizania palustris TaxID=103762 RepID=A0A8J5TB39_ZIZPA|nr:hypothetical protein GUJ93_ZPchr0014g46812 [Zizania palustris]
MKERAESIVQQQWKYHPLLSEFPIKLNCYHKFPHIPPPASCREFSEVVFAKDKHLLGGITIMAMIHDSDTKLLNNLVTTNLLSKLHCSPN